MLIVKDLQNEEKKKLIKKFEKIHPIKYNFGNNEIISFSNTSKKYILNLSEVEFNFERF